MLFIPQHFAGLRCQRIAEEGNSCQEVGGTEQAAESPAERPEDTHEEREDGANGGSDAEEEGVQGQQRQGKEETEREREEEREAERRRYNSLVAETYLLVQRALQSGPLQRSKPADFKRCKRPAEHPSLPSPPPENNQPGVIYFGPNN